MAETAVSAEATTGAETSAQAPKKKSGVMGLLVGLVLAILLGGGAFYAVSAGLVPLPGLGAASGDAGGEARPENVEPPEFVTLEPLLVSIGGPAPRQLQIDLSIETTEPYRDTVETMQPRILDALNTLLRAVDPADLADPASMDRLRAQMLRRIRIATDPTAIQDLLITKYVIF